MEQGRIKLVATTLTASGSPYLHPFTRTMTGSSHGKMVCHPAVALASAGNVFFPLSWRKYEEFSCEIALVDEFRRTGLCSNLKHLKEQEHIRLLNHIFSW